MKKLILGSTSPRRQQLLNQLGIPFTIREPNIDENSVTLKKPKEKVEQLARLKANSIPILAENEIVLTDDTIVAFGDAIFEKPNDTNEAFKMIHTLSGKTHNVYTAVAIRSFDMNTVFSVKTEVEFWELTEEEIHSYILTKEPYDKAGAYGIQSSAQIFIKRINGDYYNVVGLPISYVVRELKKFGFPIEMYLF